MARVFAVNLVAFVHGGKFLKNIYAIALPIANHNFLAHVIEDGEHHEFFSRPAKNVEVNSFVKFF